MYLSSSVCLCLSVCILWTKKKEKKRKSSIKRFTMCAHTLTYWTCVTPLCPVCSVWSVFTTSDLFCKKWHLELRDSQCCTRCTLKRSAFTEGDCAASWHASSEKKGGVLSEPFGWRCSCSVLTRFGRSLPCCRAELSCSLLRWSVVLDAVISSVHGQITVCSILSGGGLQDGEMAGGGDRGRDGGGVICCYIRKITFLLMYPSGRLLYLVVCPAFFVCIKLMKF